MSDLSTIKFAKDIRLTTLEMVYHARASHIGGAFSMADILSVLYSNFIRIDPKNPESVDRDRFLLSKGHACTSLYATLALKGFFPKEELLTYGKDGSRLLSHTTHKIPGVEISAGSLGHALSISGGLALAAKRKSANWNTYCLVSDGELNEGSNWEMILLAPQLKLDNLILIVDYNKIQSLGKVKDVINLDSLKKKFEAFNWEVFDIDGHNHEELTSALDQCQTKNGIPKVIIANTIKGKGVSFMEDTVLWHYKSPDENQYKEAILELEKN
ncbi:transketolase [Puteibacter caeruleilacunae]|nr:transketolase [Puteibacter caeruleilacunae]